MNLNFFYISYQNYSSIFKSPSKFMPTHHEIVVLSLTSLDMENNHAMVFKFFG